MATVTAPNSTASSIRKVLIPIGPKSRMINVFDWYLSHAKQDGDYLIFVHTIKPNKFAKNLSLPMLIGTTVKISASSVEDGKHACREFMCLAKKNDLQAHSYMYVDSDLNAALRKAIKELKPDAVLVNRPGFDALKNRTANNIINFQKPAFPCTCYVCSSQKEQMTLLQCR
ncbi:hypothetical protein CSKR_101396 [Clonorchis sinensis]|uniref:Uncharacterized protein n=2 Tax=Clonorchis sinensis TaxID=79923 RepID=A0A8T1MPB7_CLOSI|nr:hypothetical protein CSKR_101396 [Clonorchis sinensis]GAA55425.1 universal stress protein [Clonorchis sinensis]